MVAVTAKTYASSACVLLTFDWADGARYDDFLGFAIQRSPGYGKDGKPQFLFNKLDFVPLAKDSKPKGSDEAPIQKFNWWDGGINTNDQGKTFRYKIIPVRGDGPKTLKLQNNDATVVTVTVPMPLDGKIATYFNRAVVSSQSFNKIQASKTLEQQMDWLANGLQKAVPEILLKSDAFDCAIYHLSDNRWIIPAFSSFKGKGSITYFDKGDDDKSRAAALLIANERHNISIHKRDAISKLMHDKFIVSYQRQQKQAVLMGSTNFTPEAQTIQANLLHIIHSKDLATLYAERATLLAKNVGKKELDAPSWQSVTDVPGSDIRVYFLPEPDKRRDFLDTVTQAVQKAKSSVLFCMFTASDEDLMNAIFQQGDSKDHLIYGLLNSVDDPDKPTKSGDKRKLPAIAATIYHRSQTKPDTLPYSAFGKSAPRGFLPELKTIDASSYDVSIKKKGASSKKTPKRRGPPPIHVHHKFIVIDGDTDSPTIYTGSPNFSKSSENSNDENVLEIKGNTALAGAYVAEFMRLYNHYRARAIWNRTHEKPGHKKSGDNDPLILATTRDVWAKDAYHAGSKAAIARKRGL